jgi:hypothetical protein
VLGSKFRKNFAIERLTYILISVFIDKSLISVRINKSVFLIKVASKMFCRSAAGCGDRGRAATSIIGAHMIEPSARARGRRVRGP